MSEKPQQMIIQPQSKVQMAKTSSEWMRHAIALAVENVKDGKGGPFGAVVVKDGELVAIGVNSVTANYDPTAHAEVVAIRAACQTLSVHQLVGCELYCSCEPCPMCLGAIFWARPRVYYYACTKESAAQAGFDDAFIYSQLHLEPAKRQIPGHCLLAEEGEAPFLEWAQSIQKIQY